MSSSNLTPYDPIIDGTIAVPSTFNSRMSQIQDNVDRLNTDLGNTWGNGSVTTRISSTTGADFTGPVNIGTPSYDGSDRFIVRAGESLGERIMFRADSSDLVDGGKLNAPPVISLGYYDSNAAAGQITATPVAMIAQHTIAATTGRQFYHITDNVGTIIMQLDLTDGYLGIGDNAWTPPTAPLDLSGATVRIRTSHTPASGTATGSPGEIVVDDSFLYFCASTNSWRRAALSAF